MKNIISFTFLILTLSLSSCSTYKMDVQQGNALSNETIAQLAKGMSKDEVASILGTPLLQDNFRKNRWDYIYFAQKGRSENPEKQGITLLFQEDRLVEVRK